MSTPLQVVITDAGYAALVSAQNDGTNALRIAQVALGDGSQAADASRTALANEHTRLDSIAGEVADNATIHVTARDETDATYTVREFGLITDDGTLFAIYAQPDAIVEKAAGSVLLLPIDVRFLDVDVSSITFGSVDIINPPATEVTRGVIERADESEAQAGEDNERAMSPLRVFQAIKSFFGGATGAGAGNGLDADKVDGEHGAYYRDLQNATGTLPRARASGTYDINISGKATTAGNADQFGGRHPSYYRDAAHLTGTAPRSVLPAATTDAAGAVERATADEAEAGSDDVRYMTPAKVKGVLPTPATTERAGLVERATDREAGQGDDTTRYISPSQLHDVVQAMINRQRDIDWPIGSTYINVSDSTNPGTFLPGTWSKIEEGFLYPQGAPDSGDAGSTGGETSVRLSNEHNGPHHHQMAGTTLVGGNDPHDNYINYEGGGDNTFYTRGEAKTGESGGGKPHNNMPPYLTVYMWQRVS